MMLTHRGGLQLDLQPSLVSTVCQWNAHDFTWFVFSGYTVELCFSLSYFLWKWIL